jgi:acetoin utilization protein AcuB
MTTAEDIMTPDPAAIEETASVGEAIETLASLEIRHLPVVRGDEVVGILSDRDFAGLGVPTSSDPSTIETMKAQLGNPVSGLMSGGVITVDRSTDLVEVIDLLVSERVGALPVVEGGARLVGIVSYIDVLRAAREQIE